MVHLFTQKLNNKYSAFTVICTSIELKFSFFLQNKPEIEIQSCINQRQTC